VPDLDGTINLTGKLGHESSQSQNKIHWAFEPTQISTKKKIRFTCNSVRSEPQRGMLEKHLKEIVKYNGTVIFIEGNVEKEQKITTIGTVIYYNFMNSTELEQATKVKWCCRSGYTTIMDLAQLKKSLLYSTGRTSKQRILEVPN
jgi:hypothetical protein